MVETGTMDHHHTSNILRQELDQYRSEIKVTETRAMDQQQTNTTFYKNSANVVGNWVIAWYTASLPPSEIC